jgi:hypothetical protein
MAVTTPPKSQKTITLPSTDQLRRHRKSLVSLVLIAVVCSLGFYAGMQYQKDHTGNRATPTRGKNVMEQRFGQGGFRARRGTVASVTAVSASSITTKSNTATNTYSIGSNTVITEHGNAATTDDIKVGDTVVVTTNPNDSSHAIRIVVNPGPAGHPTSGIQGADPGSVTTN